MAFEKLQPDVDRLIDQVQPDVFLIDHLFLCPIGINRNRPRVLIKSSSKNFVSQSNMPPPKSGLAAEPNKQNKKQ